MLYKSRVINTYLYDDHNFLPFNVSQLYNSINSHQKIKVKRIQSRNCNKIKLDKVLLKKIKINPDTFYNVQNTKLYIKHINRLLQRLKSSGYISSIKIFNIHTQNHKYINLNLKMNPIVKKITILNYKRLKIPSNFLKYVFKRQIGMPKNYKLINNSLKWIYLWYKSKGFAWVNIKLIEQNMSDSKSISLQIMEGIVRDVKLTCQTKSKYNSKLFNVLDLLIKKELDIYPGSILNIKKIEAGIMRLISSNLIEDCNYIIKRDKTNLIVVINYDISKNHIAYFYNYNSNLRNYSTYQQVYTLLNKCLTYFKYFSHHLLYIQKFHIYSSIIYIDQYLGFVYKSFYLNNNTNNLSINLATSQNYPELKIVFLNPYIYKQKKLLGDLIIKLYNKIIKSYLSYPFLLIELNRINNNQRSNLLTYLYNSIFLLRHNLLKNINITERFWTRYNQWSKVDIYIQDYKINKSITKESLLRTKLFNISKSLKYIRYKLIYLQISIIYNNLNFCHQLEAGKSLKIDSKLFTYIIGSYRNNYNRLAYLGQNIGIKYIQAFNLPKIFTYIYNHTITIFSEFHCLVNSRVYGHLLHQSYNTKKHIYFKGNYDKNLPLYFFYIFNIEYDISKLKHLSIYFFWNYITYSYNQQQHKPYIENINSIQVYEMSIGSGIKFYTPIKKLPHVYLEYSINNKGKHFLGLSTASKYN